MIGDKEIEVKFEHNWGGEDTWYTKGKRWAKKQKFPIDHLALGILEWLWKHWVDGRVEMEISSVEKQAEEIKEQWKSEENAEILERFQEENPDAKVTIHDSDTGAVLIEHKPDGSVAQDLLGGTIEIKSPWKRE
jgi:hypothetical protein